MQNREKQMVEKLVLASLTCDKCGKTVEPTFGGFDGWHCMSDTGGYGSPFGDGATWTLDLCEYCFYGLVKDIVIYPNA
jgi:hypothetical protein